MHSGDEFSIVLVVNFGSGMMLKRHVFHFLRVYATDIFSQDEHFACLVCKALQVAGRLRLGPGDADRGNAGFGFAAFIDGRSLEYGYIGERESRSFFR